MRFTLKVCCAVIAVVGITACATGREHALRRQVAQREHSWRGFASKSATDTSEQRATEISGGRLQDYVGFALANSPSLAAEFLRWKASVLQISRARRLPEPVLTFGVFLSAIETRVGPQRAKLGIQQSFPWPTKFDAMAGVSIARADALERRSEAQSLAIVRRVAVAYWSLWLVRKIRDTHREHLAILRALSGTVRGRLEVGGTDLADLQQVDLATERHKDLLVSMDERELTAEAGLRAVLGGESDMPLATSEAPAGPRLPMQDSSELMRTLAEHPSIVLHEHMARSAESSARAESAERFPSFTLGADWIVTGEARMPDVVDSGRDAVAVRVGVRVPLWQRSYADAIKAARTKQLAHTADRAAALDRAGEQLEATLSDVRDTHRRILLFHSTLVPQAESAYDSVLGAYVTGNATVAQVLLAQRTLLDLRIEINVLRAEHDGHWARLQEIVGEVVPAAPSD